MNRRDFLTVFGAALAVPVGFVERTAFGSPSTFGPRGEPVYSSMQECFGHRFRSDRCSEGDHPNDDNPGDSMCRTCRDWHGTSSGPSPMLPESVLFVLEKDGVQSVIQAKATRTSEGFNVRSTYTFPEGFSGSTVWFAAVFADGERAWYEFGDHDVLVFAGFESLNLTHLARF